MEGFLGLNQEFLATHPRSRSSRGDMINRVAGNNDAYFSGVVITFHDHDSNYRSTHPKPSF